MLLKLQYYAYLASLEAFRKFIEVCETKIFSESSNLQHNERRT